MTVYIPPSLAEAWNSAISRQTAPEMVLGNFLDDWRRLKNATARQPIVWHPIEDSQALELHRWACFLAATVEYLTVRDNVPTPSWVHWQC